MLQGPRHSLMRMFIKRPSHWLLGTAMALAVAYFASIAVAEHEYPES
jgi:hypothetical protein